MKNYLFVSLYIFLFVGSANAALIQFTATDFTDTQNALTIPPEETVFGEFEYTLDSSNFLTLIAFNMTISNKTYTLTDIFIDQPFGESRVLMGDNGAANFQNALNGTNDFWLNYSFATEQVGYLSYTVAEDIGFWRSGTLTTTSIVSEPASIVLFGFGLAGMAF